MSSLHPSDPLAGPSQPELPEHEALSESLQQGFPAPRRFSRLKIWHRETTPSTALTLLTATILAVLAIWAIRTITNSSISSASVEIQQVALSDEQSDVLDLPAPAAQSPDSLVQEDSRKQVDVQEAKKQEFAPVETGKLDDNSENRRKREKSKKKDQAARAAVASLQGLQEQIAKLKNPVTVGGKTTPPLAFSADGNLLRVPSGGKVVTRGNFSAWTVPEDPLPRTDYMIVIQVKLPASVERHRVADLSGIVRGTDNYIQPIPSPNRMLTPRNGSLVAVRSADFLPVHDGVAQLLIWVPGAKKLVQDTISIRSELLKESQKLVIVF